MGLNSLTQTKCLEHAGLAAKRLALSKLPRKKTVNMSLAWLESMQAILLPKKRNRGFSQLCVKVALTATQALH